MRNNFPLCVIRDAFGDKSIYAINDENELGKTLAYIMKNALDYLDDIFYADTNKYESIDSYLFDVTGFSLDQLESMTDKQSKNFCQNRFNSMSQYIKHHKESYYYKSLAFSQKQEREKILFEKAIHDNDGRVLNYFIDTYNRYHKNEKIEIHNFSTVATINQ